MPANSSVEKGFALIESGGSAVLGLTVGKHKKLTPGQYIPRDDARKHPEVYLRSPANATGTGKTYIVIGIDIDAPFVSFPFLGPSLHGIQPGLTPQQAQAQELEDTDSHIMPLKVSAPAIVNYIRPYPPPGSAPHRYLFFLYEQPDGFDAKKHTSPNGAKTGIAARMRTSLDDLEKKMGLGPIVACNYFKCN